MFFASEAFSCYQRLANNAAIYRSRTINFIIQHSLGIEGIRRFAKKAVCLISRFVFIVEIDGSLAVFLCPRRSLKWSLIGSYQCKKYN